ncbi:MAG: nitroreductase family protein [Spirochaetales bacterium]|nr:nitroreductase family protein [Spirochaetales bacterium]
MNFADLITKRYSLRKFSPVPVESEKLAVLFTAARLAPTAGNRQPHKILVIQSEKGLSKIDLASPCRFDAPAVLVICSDRNISWKRKFDGADACIVDGSIVGAHIMLQAADIGLGSCWVMHFDPGVIRREFNLPPEIFPVALILLGYPAADAAPEEFHFQRRPLEEILVFESF